MVEPGDLGPRDIPRPPAPEHVPLQGLEPAVREHVLPPPPRHPEQIEVRELQRESHPVMCRPVAEERHVERFPVERHEEVELAGQARELPEESALFTVVAREELAENQVPIADHAEPNGEDRRRREPARLEVEEEHPPGTASA